MNPAHFPAMGGPGMVSQASQGPPQQVGQQRNNVVNQVQGRIYAMLASAQQQPPLQGWQASIPLPQRANFVYQL